MSTDLIDTKLNEVKFDARDQDAKEIEIDHSKLGPGEAQIKKEYLILNKKTSKLNLNFVSEKDKKNLSELEQHLIDDESKNAASSNHNEQKKELNQDQSSIKIDEQKGAKRESGNENDQTKQKRVKKLHGLNKKRLAIMNENNIHDQPRARDQNRLCSKFSGSFGLEQYSDIIEQCPKGSECKFSHDIDSFMKTNPVYLDDKCYVFDKFGFCGFGLRCKFGKSHVDFNGTNHNLIEKEKFLKIGPTLEKSYRNFLPYDERIKLRKKKYDFSCLEENLGPAAIDENEWKKIDFRNKLYLAPLTTVGNLPFRRVCKEFGADITCGEMAVAQNIVEGSQSEWALLRRHSSEDVFGVQLCGSNPQIMAKATKLIRDFCDVDFIDLNMGCPIDFINNNGSGCALMDRFNRLNQIVTSMSKVSNVPLTLKMRAGIHEKKFLATKVIDSITRKFNDGRIALITVHGRSKDARYTKSANWDYIRECANQSFEDKIPIFGSGDVLSYHDYEKIMNHEDSKISGAMIARGALIKPWIFTEIKEKRDWDISSKERLEILKKYVNYGLEQFGSDQEGVEKTRKFLLEWLSFLYRYIPVGLLEVLPQKINQRPPLYFGRDDLETLFASPYCNDWIKISEMFLGPVRENYIFLPKHKANAYS